MIRIKDGIVALTPQSIYLLIIRICIMRYYEISRDIVVMIDLTTELMLE